MGELLASVAGVSSAAFLSVSHGKRGTRCWHKSLLFEGEHDVAKAIFAGSVRRRRTARLWARSACVVNWPPDALCGGCVATAGGSRRPDRRHRRGAWCSVSFPGHEIWHVDRLRIDWCSADCADDRCGGRRYREIKARDAGTAKSATACKSRLSHRGGRRHGSFGRVWPNLGGAACRAGRHRPCIGRSLGLAHRGPAQCQQITRIRARVINSKTADAMPIKHPVTPDGRYFVVRGRLWRMANPKIDEDEKVRLVRRLMTTRRAVGAAKVISDHDAEVAAHHAVDETKRALGERGEVWWTDGAPDLNRHMAKSSPYSAWYAEVVGR